MESYCGLESLLAALFNLFYVFWTVIEEIICIIFSPIIGSLSDIWEFVGDPCLLVLIGVAFLIYWGVNVVAWILRGLYGCYCYRKQQQAKCARVVRCSSPNPQCAPVLQPVTPTSCATARCETPAQVTCCCKPQRTQQASDERDECSDVNRGLVTKMINWAALVFSSDGDCKPDAINTDCAPVCQVVSPCVSFTPAARCCNGACATSRIYEPQVIHTSRSKSSRSPRHHRSHSSRAGSEKRPHHHHKGKHCRAHRDDDISEEESGWFCKWFSGPELPRNHPKSEHECSKTCRCKHSQSKRSMTERPPRTSLETASEVRPKSSKD